MELAKRAPLSERLELQLTEDQKRRYFEEAAHRGVTVSEFVRRAAENAITKQRQVA